MIKAGVIFVGLLAFAATPASAGYINNKADWNRLDDRHSYVMGLYDGLAVTASNSLEDAAYSAGWHRCLQDNNITSVELVQMIDQGYAADVANWSLPPISMMLRGMRRLCETQINEALANEGLEPLS